MASCLHPVRLESFPPSSGVSADPRLRFQHRSFGRDAGLEETPQCNQEFARERHDPDLAQSLAAVPEATLVPPRQCTLWLKSQPAPGDLDRHRAHMAVARFAHPLLALRFAALEGRRRETRKSADLLSIAKLAP